MIYIDPPYGVKFGSNFQPFVRKRDVSHNDDADMTREPEMVQAYRDTWQLGLHSYLTYLRDRLLVARDLLTPSGSVFVQISDDNVHHVREVMDEVFGAGCAVVTFVVKKKGSQKSSVVDPVNDYLLWYGRSQRATGILKFRALFEKREFDAETLDEFRLAEMPDGSTMNLARSRAPDGTTVDYRVDPERFRRDHPQAKPFRPWPITNGGQRPNQMDAIEFDGRSFSPPEGRCWSFRSRMSDGELAPMLRLREASRLWASGRSLDGKRYLADFPFKTVSKWWDGLGGAADPIYVVQTNSRIVQRCILMTTDPGDLVLDPTCGSGTTAYAAEHWGRRWITIDSSRVPLTLARQRLLTATFPWFELREESAGPSNGFLYSRRQNRKGEEVGGIVPHISLNSIANDEPPGEEVLVDRPDIDGAITRISGPFVVEATLPTPQPLGDEPSPTTPPDEPSDHVARMIEVLRRSPTIALPGNRKVTLKSIRRPGRSLSLSAEAQVDLDASGGAVPLGAAIDAAHETNTGGLPFSSLAVAILFGPADGPVTAKAVLDAAKEANVKGYRHLYVIGFAITADARADIDAGEDVLGLPATFVAATMDLQMGDLLKNQRSSQIFSVCGAPDIEVTRMDEAAEDGTPRWQVKLLGLDVFDPITMQPHHAAGDDVPCWMLDSAYNGMVFHADQVFFPKTSAWDSLRKALKATHDEAVWQHLAGDTSAPFAAAVGSDIAVKVIDERGNELPVIRRLTAS
jgi:adenine-specific DNA-methyltransferase